MKIVWKLSIVYDPLQPLQSEKLTRREQGRQQLSITKICVTFQNISLQFWPSSNNQSKHQLMPEPIKKLGVFDSFKQ